MGELVSLKLIDGGVIVAGEKLTQKTTQVVYGSKGQIVKLHMLYRDEKGHMRGMVRCHSDNPAAAQFVMCSGVLGKLATESRQQLAVELAKRRMK